MPRPSVFAYPIALMLATIVAGHATADGPPVADRVDFTRDVLPILSENCFACHGPDEAARKGKVRFDTREGLFGEGRSGEVVVVPGKPAESELVYRITDAAENRHMPPAKFGKTLKPAEVETLRRWVADGAEYRTHWAFVPPTRPPVPKAAERVNNPIDVFVFDRLREKGMAPNPEADKPTLIRRVTLDLTGLPPTPAEVDAFLNDKSPDAYETVVDRLLASPRYGEHRARYWLDAARYGDTHGLHLDNYREMWPYRDYVIRAFNTNLPFDKFVIEQIAGDMLDDPTLDQIVATGFNRCHVTTSEGGSIAEEVYVRNVVDRVDTTGTVFLGLTVGCARCHDHKYDPVTQKDYYSLFAYFNSLDANPLDGNKQDPAPVTKVAGPEDLANLEKLKVAADAIRQEIAAAVAKVDYDPANDPEEPAAAKRADYVWVDDGLPAGAKPHVGGFNKPWVFAAEHVHSGDKSAKLKASGLAQFVLTGANPPLKVGAGDTLFAHVYLDPKNPPKEVMLQWHSSTWLHRAYWGENVIDFGKDNSTERFRVGDLPEAGGWVRLEVPAAKVGIKPGTDVTGFAFTQFDGTVHWDTAGVVTKSPQGPTRFDTLAAWLTAQRAAKFAGLPKPVADVVKVAHAKRTPAQAKQLREYFVEHGFGPTRPLFEPLHAKLKTAEAAHAVAEKAIPTTLISKEMDTPKPAFLLNRGEYDQKKDAVPRAVPGFLPPLPADAPNDRLGFARWLVSAEQPLTARVAVNRFWQSFFGTGLVKTSDDFGAQGEPPTHPRLLDWLAVEYRESGWDTKALMKLIVTSAAYRQSAHVTAEQLAKDPANRLVSRGPRHRLDGEALRDQALFVGGLLIEKVGGPSVKPPQPAGLWEAVGYSGSNTVKFTADTGIDKVHRRSLYTFWKRTSPPPQMSVTDAPSREACIVRRERTNTPLQALLLMNEEQYVECARGFAERGLTEAPADARLAWMFRTATQREPSDRELSVIRGLLADQKAAFEGDVPAAKKLIAVGESKPDPKLDPAELAAYTVVGNLLLNLDEVLNK